MTGYLKKIAVGFSSTLFACINVFAQETVQTVANNNKEADMEIIKIVYEYVIKYSFQALGGIIVLLLAWIIARYVGNYLSKLLSRKHLDITVAKFIVSTVKLLIMVFAAIVALGKFGIEIAPLIAGISVAGFGLSFALQGPLSNYASGATLIFTKPFKVGDIIEVAGEMGEVVDMKLPRTDIKTVDGTLIVIPNKHIVGEIIHNYSELKKVDINIGVAYKVDIDKAINIVKEVIRKDKRVVKQPNVGISQFADSAVNIYGRLWCKQDDYWNVLFDINKAIFVEFKSQGIEIPFPQREVRIIGDK